MPHIESTQDSMNRIARTNESPRYRRLALLEAIWHGKRYELECRAPWSDSSVPLAERAPCVVYPIARSAGQRITSLVFGDRSFPKPTLDTDRLTDDQKAVVLRLIDSIVRKAKLPVSMRRLLEQGLMTGSVCVWVGLRRGRLCVEPIPAKWCTPEHDAQGELVAVDIRYRYRRGELDVWFRREVRATDAGATDTTFLPVECRDDGTEPAWMPDPDKTLTLEVFPMIWHRSMPEPGTESDIDGTALHEGLADEIEALDYSLSLRHRNAEYNGEPQMIVAGAPSQGAPVISGEQGQPADPKRFSWLNGVLPAWARGGDQQPGLKKAPDKVWKLAPGATADLLESSGAGATILEKDASELRKMILEVMQVVMADPETLGAGDLSARALSLMMGPMLALCDNLRVEYGDLLCAVIDKCVRWLLSARVADARVDVEGLDAARPLLAAFDFGLPLTLAWGEYFPPSWSEITSAITAAKSANGDRPVLTQRSAIKLVASLLGVDSVDDELAGLEAEASRGTADLTGMLGALGDKPAAPVVAQAEADGVTVPPSTTGDAAVTAEGAAVAQGELPDLYGYDLDADIVTVNEVRARRGFDPIAGGNVSISVWKAQQQAEAARVLAGAGVVPVKDDA